MRFDRLDLNLLQVLDALLRERSVSVAAERVHLSQSATSSSLSRLRTFFDDDLLVMRGRGMALTPRAEELAEPVAAILSQIRATITTPKTFEPGVSERGLRIMTSDYSVEALVAPTIRAVAQEAPGISYNILQITDEPIELLGRGTVDIIVTTDTVISTEHPSAPLFVDDFVVAGWKGNPALVGGMTRELYSALGHVVVRFGTAQIPSFEEFVLRHGGIERRIEVTVPSFVSVASLVEGSARIATMHRILAKRLERQYELVVMDAPFEIPSIRLVAQWPASSARDPAVQWFVDRLRRQAAAEFAGALSA